MTWIQKIVGTLEYYTWTFGPEIFGEPVPIIVILLLGTGLYLTFRLRFLQFWKLGHGFVVTTGKYDNSSDPGDVSHFQALTTALSATVGIGNIAGVAIAIHFGGPGALFWMWITALLGMAIKYSEVTLAHHYRSVEKSPSGDLETHGVVSGGPMYYIERGLGSHWKPLAVFFACSLIFTSFLTGNAIQANTVSDVMFTDLGIPHWVTGLVTSIIVFLIIVGGIRRIGKVTGFLAPFMAALYVLSALTILLFNYEHVLPTINLICREAFNPAAGVAGTGMGFFLTTMMWGVRRGLFSNESGQGSAPIAHAAAKTDEPASEGVVALLEPLIDTLVICTMTGLVILITGVWTERVPTTFNLSSGDISYVTFTKGRQSSKENIPEAIHVQEGYPINSDGDPIFAWHDVPVEEFFLDSEYQIKFSGAIYPHRSLAISDDGDLFTKLYGKGVENGAPLTALAFERGLGPLGSWGKYIVLLSVALFAISTAISWSYYGNRCALYLFGPKAILPFKIFYVLMHFLGSVFALSTVWILGDVAMGMSTFANLLALVLLAGVTVKLTKSYFERKPWLN